MENKIEGALSPVPCAYRFLDLAQDDRAELDVTWLVDAVNIAEGGREQVATPLAQSQTLIDRLLHHAVVLVTTGESFRMREARTRGGGVPLKVD